MIAPGSASLFLDIFDSLSIPVFILDSAGKIRALNATASEALHYSAGDLLGCDVGEIIAPDPRSNFSHTRFLDAGALEEPSETGFEALCTKKNGETFAARVTIIPREGDGSKILVLQNVSDQRKLEQRSFQRTKELGIFSAFANLLTVHSNTGELLDATIAMLLAQMGTDKGWISLLDKASGELSLAASKGFSVDQLRDIQRLKPGESFTGKVFSSGRSLLVRTASNDPRVKFRHLGIESMVGVPISSRGVVLGVLAIASRRADHFTSMDVQLLTIIGTQLGVALENMNLIRELRDRMEEIQLVNELSGILNSSLSIGTIFRMAVSEIKKLIDYDRASLLLYNEKENNLLIFALDTGMSTEMKKGVTAPIEGTSAGWVVKNNKPWINEDLSTPEFALDKKLFSEGIRSTISIPLSHDRILGVFNLDSKKTGTYSEKDLNILLPVAKQISVALENALLFEAISREKKEWERTFDAITDMVWIEDGKEQVIRANQALLRSTGLTPIEVSGRKCSDLLQRIGVSAEECFCRETILEKKPCFKELKGGGSIFHFWAYPLIDEEGRLYSLVHYLKDVTAQKSLEQELIRSDKLASLGTLVAGIAHEINNPLGIIAGYAEALLDRAKERSLLDAKEFEDFPEYLTTIHHEIFRCKSILRSLLDFARPSGGVFREIDINELIKEVILLVNHKAKRLDHQIELRLNRDLPKLFADPGSLRQLFMNIIINSLYFTPEKGTITIVSEMEESRDEALQGNIKVSITDTGTGIHPALIEKIFDPFFTTKPIG
ncbi:MAG: GAF domain-containing protein, partial [bacterium]